MTTKEWLIAHGIPARRDTINTLDMALKEERENAAIRVAQFHADYAKDISIGAVKAAMGEQ